MLLGKVRPRIKWADVEAVKVELQAQLDLLLGGITEEDLREPDKKKKKKVLFLACELSCANHLQINLHCSMHSRLTLHREHDIHC